MRWTKKPVPDLRVRGGFLTLPKTIGGETRWLEHAYWLEEYDGEFFECSGWYAVNWINPDEPIPYTVTPAGKAALEEGQ